MWQYTPYTIPLAAAVLVAVVTTFAVWRQREGTTEVWGAVIIASIALWGALHLLVVSNTVYEWKLFLLLLFVADISLLVISVFCFTLYFTGNQAWLTRRRVLALLAFPLAVALVSLADGVYELGLVVVDPQLDQSGSFPRLRYRWGPAMYAFAVVEYSTIGVSSWLLGNKFLRSRNVYRTISFVLFASITGLTALTFLSISRVSPFPHFMLLPLAYLLVAFVLIPATLSAKVARAIPVDRVYTAVSSRFGDIVPLARDFIVEEMDNGILVVDADGRIVDVNTMAKKMLGVERPVGKHLRDISQPERVIEWGVLGEMLGGDRPLGELRDEVWLDTANGERCYDVSITSIGDGAGDSVGYAVLLHDITEQKRREETLRERELELERQKRDLETRKTQLEHQNERLDRFAGIVSHDLRNPLNVAQGYLETVPEADLEGTVELEAETIEAVAESHDRMQDLIEDALTMAREGKAITEMQRVDLSAIATEAWGNVRTGEAALSTETERSIDADPDRLLTLFENLFRNSVEHGSTDGNELTVTVGHLESGDGFYVEDDGAGIPDDRKEEILEHGFSTSEDGTGFGLTIVEDVASAHGWTLEIADGEDGGFRAELTGVGVFRAA